jgi:hypothetical protein
VLPTQRKPWRTGNEHRWHEQYGKHGTGKEHDKQESPTQAREPHDPHGRKKEQRKQQKENAREKKRKTQDTSERKKKENEPQTHETQTRGTTKANRGTRNEGLILSHTQRNTNINSQRDTQIIPLTP